MRLSGHSTKFLAGWMATFPLDVVKTRIQGSFAQTGAAHAPLLGHSHSSRHVEPTNPFRSTLSTVVYSYKMEGMGVFFRGLVPTLIRCVSSLSNRGQSAGTGFPDSCLCILVSSFSRRPPSLIVCCGAWLTAYLNSAIPVNMVTFATFEAIVHAFS